MNGIIIEDCRISKFLHSAINFAYSDTDRTHFGGYEKVKVINCEIDSIGHLGIVFSWFRNTLYSFSEFPHKDIIIKDCAISRVTGFSSASLPDPSYTGTGVLLIDVDSVLVEGNKVSSCGGISYPDDGSGPDGIESQQSQRVIYQFNEVFDQKTTTESDGAGLHLGDGVQNSIVQYNYSHDNDGAGINCMCGLSNYPLENRNNIIRYNICAKNGRRNGDGEGEIHISGFSPKTTQNIQIYNNTLYAVKHIGYDRSVFLLYRQLDSILFRNNILVSADTSVALFSHSPVGGNYTNIYLQGNVYWSIQERFKFREYITYYYSFNNWQNELNYEKLNNSNVGITENPQLIDPENENFKTEIGSVVKENGLDLYSLFGTNVGDADFFGTTIPVGCKYDLGAYEDTSNVAVIDLFMLIEGFYNTSTNSQVGDSVQLIIRNSSSPYARIDSNKSFVNETGKGKFIINHLGAGAIDGSFYFVIKHRNSIETWSKLPQYLALKCRMSYDFTIDSTKAFGDNTKRIDNSPLKYGFYNGDVNQDGIIDGSDFSLIENDDQESGYIDTDINGDNFVDGTDNAIAQNNNQISIISP